MLLVLFFSGLFAIIIYETSLKIHISNLELSTVKSEKTIFNIKLNFYLFNKIKIISIKLNENILKNTNKTKILNKIKDIDYKKIISKIISQKNLRQNMKKNNIKIEQLNFKIEIDTENMQIVTFLIPIIATCVATAINLLERECKKENYSYIIKPLYVNKNMVKLYANCIISLKLVHIIYIIYIFFKKGNNKNE